MTSNSRRNLSFIMTFALTMAMVVGAALMSTEALAQDDASWCGTHQIWVEKMARQGVDVASSPDACIERGPCDDPSVREPYIPDAEQPITYIRLALHILSNDDGSSPVSTEATAIANLENLNADYLPVRIQFEYTIDFIRSTQYKFLSENEQNALKSTTAVKPDSQLNVWLVVPDYGYSYGTFPWDSEALTNTGGIIMGDFHWGVAHSVLAHEVGHCLGLYHTFNGVEEVSQCGACYEHANTTEGDVRGDRCDDTPPHPLTYNCSNTGGTDPCSGVAWGYTMPENYMGYSPQSCYTTFTPKQQGRIHCWTNDILESWIVGVSFSADTTFGPAPLTVTFDGKANKTVNTWDWDLGDGSGSSTEDPVHEYTQPGFYDVGVTIQTPDGPYASVKAGYVSVHADTVMAEEVTAGGAGPVRVDIDLTNYIPVEEAFVPVSWDGPFSLVYDSLTFTGLRTEYFELTTWSVFDVFNDRGVIRLLSSSNGSAPLLTPGSGPVASLWFTLAGSPVGSHPITIAPFNGNDVKLRADAGEYEPTYFDGAVIGSCCIGSRGNIELTPACFGVDQTVDITDLTNLINHLFIDFTPICCIDEGDISPDGGGDGVVDIGDLTALINFLFITFVPPQTCF